MSEIPYFQFSEGQELVCDGFTLFFSDVKISEGQNPEVGTDEPIKLDGPLVVAKENCFAFLYKKGS